MAKLIINPVLSTGELLDANYRQALDARWMDVKQIQADGTLDHLVAPTLQAFLFNMVLPVTSLVLGIEDDANACRGLLNAVGLSVATNVTEMLNAVIERNPLDGASHFASLVSDTVKASIDYLAQVLGKSVLQTILHDFSGILKIIDEIFALIDLARFDFDTTNTPLTTVFQVNFTGDVGVVLRTAASPSPLSTRRSGGN